jgi:hypothetical protein
MRAAIAVDLQTSGAWALVVFQPIILARACQRREPAYLFNNIPTRHGGWPDREKLDCIGIVVTKKVYRDSGRVASPDARQAS